jgi:hypothetical protein
MRLPCVVHHSDVLNLLTHIPETFCVPINLSNNETSGPFMAQLGHAAVVALCPLLGAERKTYAPIELFSF